MKTVIRVAILLTTIIVVYSCSSNRKLAEPKSIILPLSDTVPFMEGSIVYSLPRTVFTVFVEMERNIKIPGPYSKFAGDLLGLNDVIQEESESWSLHEITVKTTEELDPSEFYVISSNTLFQTNVLALKKEGLIMDINPGIFYSSESRDLATDRDASQISIYDLGSDEYFLEQNDTAYKRVVIDSTFIRIPYIIEKKKRLTIDQMADKAARRLMEMREGKHLILTGEANVFPQSDAAINEMNRIEKEYTELFTGKTWKEIRKYSYQIIPRKDMAGKPFILFLFSEVYGPVSGAKKEGIPVTIELTPEQKVKGLTIVSKKPDKETEPVYDKLFYRVPDVVNLKISLGNETLLNSRKLIYQFGEVIQLPANYIIGK